MPASGAESVGALVVAAVVEGEQCRLASAAGEVDVVNLRLGDDLVREVGQCLFAVVMLLLMMGSPRRCGSGSPR